MTYEFEWLTKTGHPTRLMRHRQFSVAQNRRKLLFTFNPRDTTKRAGLVRLSPFVTLGCFYYTLGSHMSVAGRQRHCCVCQSLGAVTRMSDKNHQIKAETYL